MSPIQACWEDSLNKLYVTVIGIQSNKITIFSSLLKYNLHSYSLCIGLASATLYILTRIFLHLATEKCIQKLAGYMIHISRNTLYNIWSCYIFFFQLYQPWDFHRYQDTIASGFAASAMIEWPMTIFAGFERSNLWYNN